MTDFDGMTAPAPQPNVGIAPASHSAEGRREMKISTMLLVPISKKKKLGITFFMISLPLSHLQLKAKKQNCSMTRLLLLLTVVITPRFAP